MKALKIYMTMGLLLVSSLAMAQISRISGTVSDDFDVLPGVNVVEIDASNRMVNATVTDMNGNFVLPVKSQKNKVKFSYMGFKTITLPINKTVFKVKMEENAKQMTEVQVTAKKKLKVHSPSKVFSWIGEMTGAGFVRGIDSMGRQISTATMDMIRIPRAESPRLAYAGDGRLNDNYTYGGSRYEITVVSEIDGKEFARATVDPMSEELNRKNRNMNRSKGQR